MAVPLRVLIVEDSEDDALLAIEQLETGGYSPDWTRVGSAEEMRAALRQQTWDAVISDHGMPEFSSLEALRLLREHGIDIPFIIVSGTIGEELAVAAMKAGAHDYVMKGNLPRLPAAIEREIGDAKVREERRKAEAALRESNLRLTEALDTLRRVQGQMVQQERIDALQQLAGGVVHDIHNLMAPIAGFAELLLTRPERLADQKKATEDLEKILTASKDVLGLTRRLRQFYRPAEESEPLLPVSLNRLVQQCIAFTEPRWRHEAGAAGVAITVETAFAEVPPALGDDGELREVLTNLIFNAVDALPAGGTITIRTRREDGQVIIEVRDTGVGMSEAVLKRCLEPFYTTKGSKGTGMGLAIVYGIVQRQGGSLNIESAVGKGTAVTMRLRAADEDAARSGNGG